MKIIIETIPHSEQRYPTVGDWYYTEEPKFIENNDGTGTREPTGIEQVLHIKVSKMENWRYEALVAIHELAEVLMCKFAGVTQEQVDMYDMEFEKNRKPGDVSEPGDYVAAPYFKQHGVASGIERIIGAELGVDWNNYADAVEALP